MPTKKKTAKNKDRSRTKYTTALAEKICCELAQGKSLRTICRDNRFPCIKTIYNWLRVHEEFKQLYEGAKQDGCIALAEEMFDIADNGTNDWMEAHDKDGNCTGYKINGEAVQRSRLRIDTRKWFLSKILPSKYGDKLDVTGDLNQTISLAQLKDLREHIAN